MSPKELAMIEKAAPRVYEMLCKFSSSHFNPIGILEMAASEAFLDNNKGPAVDSLRRCLNATHRCNPYRETPEYEALIQLEELK